jgi:hypothetical protein
MRKGCSGRRKVRVETDRKGGRKRKESKGRGTWSKGGRNTLARAP